MASWYIRNSSFTPKVSLEGTNRDKHATFSYSVSGALGLPPYADDGQWLVTANLAHGSVTLVDINEGRHRTTRIPKATQLVGLAFRPDPVPRIYVTAWNSGDVIALEP